MYDVTVRYKSSKADTFRAESVDFSANDIGMGERIKEFTSTTPSGNKASIFLTPKEVAGIVQNEVPDVPGPTFG